MRAFVAIDVGDAVRDALERVQDDLPVGRLADPGTFHVTLAFLDDQPPPALAALNEALEGIRAAPFALALRGVDIFGGDRPRVVWAGVEAAPELKSLRDKVRGAARSAGVELPRERFRPHVTLARFRRLDGGELARLQGFLAHHADASFPSVQVAQFTLYRSVLHPDGPVHDALADYPLAG